MNLINNIFDRTVCINLVNRPDKKKLTQEKFDNIGINVEWYKAIQYGFIPNLVPVIIQANAGHFNISQPYEMGCALSHYSVIKQALEENVEKLFVFEDDVCFHKNFNERFEKSFNVLPENWDMMMLYAFQYELFKQNVRVNSRWMRAAGSWSLMAYGMNRKTMEGYIKHQDKFFSISDMVTWNMQNEDYNIYVATPSLVVPNPTLESNIRSTKNYQVTTTATNLGVSPSEYI